MSAASPYDTVGFFYYQMSQLQTVRSGRYKLYLPLSQKSSELSVRGPCGVYAELYDLYGDVGETENITASQSEIVARLTMMAESARAELGDTDLEGSGQRLAGWCDDP